MNDWLTAEQVEHIQWAVQRNRPVSGFVNGLRHATLPALLEYGCLRASIGPDAIPPLPAAIVESPLGQSLDEFPSRLGFHNSLNRKKKLDRVDTRTAEFFSISTEDELENDSPDQSPKPWQLYAIRFSRSAQAAGFHETVANGLMAALYEMTRNASNTRNRRIPHSSATRLRTAWLFSAWSILAGACSRVCGLALITHTDEAQ